MKVLDQSTICLNIDTPQQKLAPPKVRSIEQSMVQMDLWVEQNMVQMDLWAFCDSDFYC